MQHRLDKPSILGKIAAGTAIVVFDARGGSRVTDANALPSAARIGALDGDITTGLGAAGRGFGLRRNRFAAAVVTALTFAAVPSVSAATPYPISPVRQGPMTHSAVYKKSLPGVTTEYVTDLTQADFFPTVSAQASVGKNLIDIDVRRVGNTTYYSGIFDNSSAAATQLWVLSLSDFIAKTESLKAAGLRIIDLETYNDGTSTWYVGLFRPGSGDQHLITGVTSFGGFGTQTDAQANIGYFLTSLEHHIENGQEIFAGVFRQTGIPSAHVLWAGDWNSFAKENFDLAGAGLRLVDFEATEVAGERKYLGTWLSGSDPYDLVSARTASAMFDTYLENSSLGLSPAHMETEMGYMPPAGMAAAFHDHLDLKGVMGYSYAIAEKGKVVAKGGFGYERAPWEPTNPGTLNHYFMTESSRFDGASIGKIPNVVRALQWSDNQPFFPSALLLDIVPPPAGTVVGDGFANVTMLDLMLMETGLWKYVLGQVTPIDVGPGNTNAWYKIYVSQNIPQAVGVQSAYSGADMSALRRAVEAVAGSSFPSWVQNTFASLGDPGVNCTPGNADTSPLYYDAFQTTPGSSGFPASALDAACGAGGIHASAQAWLDFLMALRSNSLISQNSLDLLVGRGVNGKLTKQAMGGGGHLDSIHGLYFGKNGGWTYNGVGTSASLALLPDDTQMALLVNTNGFDTDGIILEGFNWMHMHPMSTNKISVPFTGVTPNTLQCFSIQGDRADDTAPLIDYNCLSPLPNNQQFVFIDVGGGNFMIQAKSSGKCLTVQYNDPSDNLAIYQWSCVGGQNQFFKPVPSRGRLQLRTSAGGATNSCVTVQGWNPGQNTPLIQYTCITGGQDNQEFNVLPL
ncbi:MAG TPA: serine hydrolase [Kofleriaceae bacterium]|jgi:hypothetical protein|nr:serine hydrolase [Kofleriaceae bacterium]